MFNSDPKLEGSPAFGMPDIPKLAPGDIKYHKPPYHPAKAACTEEAAKEMIRQLLMHIGEDPNREGLRDTPTRVLRAWRELFRRYRRESELKHLMTVFENDGHMDEMVICRNIEFASTCEHHMLPFVGHATVAYLPTDRILGLSKMARVVDLLASSLQVQERLTTEIANAFNTNLQPKGVGVVVRAKHMCMACRGVRKADAEMVTSAMRGVFKTDPTTRAEFLRLATGG